MNLESAMSGWTLAILFLAPLAVACGDSGSGAPKPTEVVFSPGLDSAASDVRLVGDVSGDRLTLHVIVGPTSAEIYGLAFDLQFDNPGLLEFAGFDIGPALGSTSGDLPEVLVHQRGDRYTIGVSKLGDVPGNSIEPEPRAVASLSFLVVGLGETSVAIAGSPPHPPTALESDGAGGALVFDDGFATITGS